ncbi:MAG: hypothetical protein ACR2PT_23800 [Endozoicomonas sp.]
MNSAVQPAPLIIGDHVLPQRTVDTEQGRVWVPMHVYRNAKGHGWNVYIHRESENTNTFSKYFGDNGYGGQERSLEYALECLYDEMPHHTPHNRLHPGSSLYYYIREQHRRRSGCLQTSVQTYICSYRHRLRCISFYVGTENTKTAGRLQRAIDRAMGTRQWSIDTIKQEGRDVLFKMPVPRNIENYGF